MEVHTETQNTDIILTLEFQKKLSNESRKHGILDHGKPKKVNKTKLDKQRVPYAT